MEAQVIDVDCVQVGKGERNPAWVCALRSNKADFLKTADAGEIGRKVKKKGFAYLVRVWCRTFDGRSLCILVVDPWSTSYRKLRPSDNHEEFSKTVLRLLNARSQTSGMAEIAVVERKTTQGFHKDPKTGKARTFPWLRIRVASAYLRGQVTSALCTAQQDIRDKDIVLPFEAESCVEVHSELLERAGIRPGGWLRLGVPTWQRVEESSVNLYTKLTLQITVDDLLCPSSDSESMMAPMTLLSWDIECYSKNHAFPLAELDDDCIIAIGMCTRTLYGQGGVQNKYIVLCLGETTPSETDVEIKCYYSEEELLYGFANVLAASDADFIVGYNTCGFDWCYVRDRIAKLGSLGKIDSGGSVVRYSRVAALACAPTEEAIASSAMGDNPLCYPRTPGRVGVDLWFYLKRVNSPDLPNLKLDTVAAHYLKDNKVNLPAKAMFAEYEKGKDGRLLVAEYCCKDCVLVLDLMEKLGVVPELMEMAKVTKTIPEDLLYRGQQIKVYTQLLSAAHRLDDYVVEDPPNLKQKYTDDDDDNEDNKEKYKGAHVEEPLQGYYRDPILTVDFASLYPSLMRTYNLSPDTMIRNDEDTDVPHSVINISEDREPLRFVSGGHVRGLLPQILDALLFERTRVKKEMAAEKDPFKRQLLNAKQLALKISANSVYGACGATKGLLQCREVAEATTCTGRDIIAFTKKTIEQDYRIPGCTVVYGDSVTGDTSLIVRRAGVIETVRIDELAASTVWSKRENCEKQEVHFAEGAVEVWQDGGFTEVRRLIRHMCDKPLMRVLTHTGLVDCTTDHSLLLENGKSISPAHVERGDRLLHADDSLLLKQLSGDTYNLINTGEAFAMGLFVADGSCGCYKTHSGIKYSWAINNRDVALLMKTAEGLPFTTKILDTLKSSSVYKLVPVGSVKDTVLRYRALFYNGNKEKRIPPVILGAPLVVIESFWRGFYAGDGGKSEQQVQRVMRFDQRGKETATGLWILGRRLGYRVSINDRDDKENVFRLTFSKKNESSHSVLRRSATAVKRTKAIHRQAAYVFDLETSSHHFHVAPGDLVVHNTDSAFVRLPQDHHKIEDSALFYLGEEMAEQVTASFRDQLPEHIRGSCVVTLEMEKFLRPLILYKKKKYVGIAYEEVGKPGKLLAKGIELVRRDAVPLVRTTQQQVVDFLLKEGSPEKAVNSVKDAVQCIEKIQPGGPFAPIVLSKSLRKTYANPEGMPHVKVMQLMKEREEGSEPRIGDRVEYVVIASDCPRVVDKVEDIGYATENALPPDWYYYVEALERPLLRVLEVPLQSDAPGLHAELLLFFKEAKNRALARRNKEGRARYGTEWFKGSVCKRGGPPQQKITAFFGIASSSSGTGASAVSAEPTDTAVTREATTKRKTAACESLVKRSCVKQLDGPANKTEKYRQSTL